MTAVAVTQPRVVRSEWTKFVTVRSTLWSLGAGTLLTLAFPIIFAAVTGSHWGTMSVHERADRHPLDIALAGVNVSQLAIAVLGVLVITGEYSTGMIRSSFLAVPRRLPVLWAKLGVFSVVAFAVTLPAIIVSFYASQAILDRHHILQISISAPGVLRSLLGGALYVAGVGVFALAIGAIVRQQVVAERGRPPALRAPPRPEPVRAVAERGALPRLLHARRGGLRGADHPA